MTEIVFVLLAIVLLVTVVIVVRSRRSSPPPPRTDPLADYPETWDPYRIGVGDIIGYAGIDHVVRGTLTLDEDGYRWHEHLLDGSTGQRWLTVENDEGTLDMTLWIRRQGTGLEPGGDVILDDRVYRQIEYGTARFTAEGTTGTAPEGTMQYADYATADGTGLLAFERWARAGSWETSTGRSVTRSELSVIHAGPPQ